MRKTTVGDVEEGIHRKRISADLKWLAGEIPGRRILRYIHDICGQNRSSIPADVDPHKIWANEGARWVWLKLQTAMNLKDEELPKVIEEDE